jgi:hypothetical protein
VDGGLSVTSTNGEAFATPRDHPGDRHGVDEIGLALRASLAALSVCEGGHLPDILPLPEQELGKSRAVVQRALDPDDAALAVSLGEYHPVGRTRGIVEEKMCRGPSSIHSARRRRAWPQAWNETSTAA